MTGVAAIIVALAIGSALASSVAAQTQGASDIGLGKRPYQDKATCGFCHGWSGDGAGDPQSPGKAANRSRA
jgi:cytochrome c553